LNSRGQFFSQHHTLGGLIIVLISFFVKSDNLKKRMFLQNFFGLSVSCSRALWGLGLSGCLAHGLMGSLGSWAHELSVSWALGLMGF
jgi:hypothetical protein